MKKVLEAKEHKTKSKSKNTCKYILKLTYTLSTSTKISEDLKASGVNDVDVVAAEKYFDVFIPINKTSMIDRSCGNKLPVYVKKTINSIINTLNSQYKSEYGEDCYIDKILKTEIMAYNDDTKLDMYRGRIYS